MRWLVSIAAAATVVVAAPEVAHACASRRGFGPSKGPGGAEAIIVLGCPSNPDGSLHPLQRWRVEIAARSLNPRTTTVVFTGTTATTGLSEAAVMAAHAPTRGIPEQLIVLEEQARSTWQNLLFSAPLVSECDVIRVVSDPMHAWRARQFLARQDPRLAARLAPTADYRPLERWRWKLHTLIYECVARYREWRSPRLPT